MAGMEHSPEWRFFLAEDELNSAKDAKSAKDSPHEHKVHRLDSVERPYTDVQAAEDIVRGTLLCIDRATGRIVDDGRAKGGAMVQNALTAYLLANDTFSETHIPPLRDRPSVTRLKQLVAEHPRLREYADSGVARYVRNLFESERTFAGVESTLAYVFERRNALAELCSTDPNLRYLIASDNLLDTENATDTVELVYRRDALGKPKRLEHVALVQVKSAGFRYDTKHVAPGGAHPEHTTEELKDIYANIHRDHAGLLGRAMRLPERLLLPTPDERESLNYGSIGGEVASLISAYFEDERSGRPVDVDEVRALVEGEAEGLAEGERARYFEALKKQFDVLRKELTTVPAWFAHVYAQVTEYASRSRLEALHRDKRVGKQGDALHMPRDVRSMIYVHDKQRYRGVVSEQTVPVEGVAGTAPALIVRPHTAK